jgi:hypothetical protein
MYVFIADKDNIMTWERQQAHMLLSFKHSVFSMYNQTIAKLIILDLQQIG